MATARGKVVPKQQVVDDAWEGVKAVDAEAVQMSGVVPDDFYAVHVAKAYFRESKASAKMYINLELIIDEGAYKGRYLFMPFYVESDSENFRKGQKGFLARTFEVATGSRPDDFPTSDEDLADLVNTNFKVKVTVEQQPNLQNPAIIDEQNRVMRVYAIDEQVGEGGATTAPATTRAAPAQSPAPAPTRFKQRPAATAFDLDTLTWDSVHALSPEDLERLISQAEISDDVLDDNKLVETVCLALRIEQPQVGPPAPPGRRRGAAGTVTAATVAATQRRGGAPTAVGK